MTFVQSARIILFVYEAKSDLTLFAQRHGISLIPFEPEPGVIMTSTRWFRFLDYLQSPQGAAFEKVLLSDIRDVIFQSDPFATAFPTPLVLADEGLPISTNCNADWIAAAYGPDVLEQLKDRSICCCGTVIGDRAGILSYLRAMCTETTRVREAHKNWGTDQASLNFLLWKGAIPERYLDGEDKLITTLTRQKSWDYQIESPGRITKAGYVPPIVHQWDRHAESTALVDRLYPRAR